ncbi:MAG: hypothetical protein J6W29_04125 [Neisseriaceae bacterium]|nr:hypothetical protein [Neisseriaceae bacterium]MBP5789401.1 hypothetical protein [Neisseriaceae bacterium]MBQ1837761.1 hypothetical protein [Neisseriaceae bacterium]MBQ5429725.1 hypothetical protein [Neisseriaceae bacterium]
MPTLISHSPQEFSNMYGRLSYDEQNTIVSLMEIFLRKKTHTKPTNWQSFIAAAKNNQEELPRMPQETNSERLLFADWKE